MIVWQSAINSTAAAVRRWSFVIEIRREKPPRAELLALLLGPTGNLRAPTLRKGRTLIVGFDETTYTDLLV